MIRRDAPSRNVTVLRDLTQQAMGLREVDTLLAAWRAKADGRGKDGLSRAEALLALHLTEFCGIEAKLPETTNRSFESPWAADYLAASVMNTASLTSRVPRDVGQAIVDWTLDALYCAPPPTSVGSADVNTGGFPRPSTVDTATVLKEAIAVARSLEATLDGAVLARLLELVEAHYRPPPQAVSADGTPQAAPTATNGDDPLTAALSLVKACASTRPHVVVDAVNAMATIAVSQPWIGSFAKGLQLAVEKRNTAAVSNDVGDVAVLLASVEAAAGRICDVGLAAAAENALDEVVEVSIREVLDLRARVAAIRQCRGASTAADVDAAFDQHIRELANVGGVPSLETKAEWVCTLSSVDLDASVALLRRVVAELPRKRVSETEGHANARMHTVVIEALCKRNGPDDVSLASSIIGSHKYFGLRVGKEMILPLLRVLAPRGDSRVFNLVDVCTLFSGCAIDEEVIALMFACARAANDHHRAKALFTMLRDESPGILTKLSSQCIEDLRWLKVLPPMEDAWIL